MGIFSINISYDLMRVYNSITFFRSKHDSPAVASTLYFHSTLYIYIGSSVEGGGVWIAVREWNI